MKTPAHLIHGKGSTVFEIDMGVADGRWGKILHLRANNVHDAMRAAKRFDILRLFTPEQYRSFLQEFQQEPHPVRIYNRRTQRSEYHWYEGFRKA